MRNEKSRPVGDRTASQVDSVPATTKVEDTARARRAAAMQANAAAYAHLHAYGLTSETVVLTLQQCLREAA